MIYIFRNTTIEGDAITDADKRQAVRSWLLGRVAEGTVISEGEIDQALGDWEAELSEKVDLSALGQQAANEIAYLETDIVYLQGIIPTIDGMTTLTQLRAVVKGLTERSLRLEQENLKVIKAMRYLVRLSAMSSNGQLDGIGK